MATDAVVADLPPASQWTFRPDVPWSSTSERRARAHAPILDLARDCVAPTVTGSRVFFHNDAALRGSRIFFYSDAEPRASFIKQAQMVASDPAKVDRMVPVLRFYTNAHHRSNVGFPPFVAAFAVELFRHHQPLIRDFMPDHVYDVYCRLAQVFHYVVLLDT